jgi:ABC-type sugar transport system permease subunit
MVGLVDVAAVIGTYLVFTAFLSLTTHLAARNVLGDVHPDRSLQVGPFTAAVSFVFLLVLGTDWYVPLLAVPTAVAVDVTAIRRVYDLDWRLAVYVTFIHAVITVLLAAVIGAALSLLARSPPGGA